MGRINIIGGSPLKMDFELDSGLKSPENFKVKLVEHSSGKWYEVEREDGTTFGTARGAAAKMRVTGVGSKIGAGSQIVVVEYDE